VICGTAPVVGHAAFSATRVWVFDEEADYSCNSGYSTDGAAGGPKEFKGKCTAGGEFSGIELCHPEACPPTPIQPNADFPDTGVNLVFSQKTTVTCHDGYALDKDQHGQTNYEIECHAEGQLGISHEGCVAIDCGTPPQTHAAFFQGHSLFGTKMTVATYVGWTIDGKPGSATQYLIQCPASGDFAKTADFQRVTCGAPPAKSGAGAGVINTADEADLLDGATKHELVTVSPECAIESDLDYPGEDYKQMRDVVSADVCRSHCANDYRCKSWTFGKKPGQSSTNVCYLKNGHPDRSENDCCDSGLKCARASTLPVVACENPGDETLPGCVESKTGTCHGKARLGYQDKWSKWKDVDGEFQCSNSNFGGDPHRGQAKECVCEANDPALEACAVVVNLDYPGKDYRQIDDVPSASVC